MASLGFGLNPSPAADIDIAIKISIYRTYELVYNKIGLAVKREKGATTRHMPGPTSGREEAQHIGTEIERIVGDDDGTPREWPHRVTLP